MLYILVGCIGFLLFILYDLNQIRSHKKHLRYLFVIGFLLVTFSTFMIIWEKGYNFIPILSAKIVFGGLATVSLLLLIYSLFFALPFEKTYITASNRNVCDQGMYALCRHPGALWFILFYLFLWLYTGIALMFWAFLSFSLLNLLYIWLQDRYFFPKLFDNYTKYKATTPFIIPTNASIKRFISSIRIR
jgi:protein-S-isoprenylcysteine O-methyltransferase Ste14